MSLEIFISAGEASSDLHGAHLIRELKSRASVRFFGLGGEKMLKAGIELLMHNKEFSVGGGPLEVLSKLPKRRQLETALERRLFQSRPQGAILIDNGEINLRLAALLHFFGVPVIYFIPPKVWVWRLSRLEAIAKHIDLVLGILPFEKPLYAEWGIPFQYIGNPLIEELPPPLSEKEAKKKLGIDPEIPVLAVFPGSRHSEVRHHVKIFAQAVKEFADQLPESERKPTVVIPAAPSIEVEGLRLGFEEVLKPANIEIQVVKGSSFECLCAARAALVKSGTSTLEAGLVGVPMVLAYRSSRSSEWLFRNVVRYKGFVGLVNLFLAKDPAAALGWSEPEEPVVKELILKDCTPTLIAAELHRVYADGPVREKMVASLSRLRGLLAAPPEQGASPLESAAKACLKYFAGEY